MHLHAWCIIQIIWKKIIILRFSKQSHHCMFSMVCHYINLLVQSNRKLCQIMRMALFCVNLVCMFVVLNKYDDVIKWKHFPHYWPFVRGIHRSLVNSPHKGQWHGAFMFSLICTWINTWVNNCEAGDLRRHCTHYDVIVMNDWTSIQVSTQKHHHACIYKS